MDILSILREKQQEIIAYEVAVQGLRAEKHPMVFVELAVEHILTGHHLQQEIVAQAINLSATCYCGAGIMLAHVAHMTHTFRIKEAE